MRAFAGGISLLLLLGHTSPAAAQPMVPGGGMQRPAVSPYINLIRGNAGFNNAALNYFGIVRPEQQFRQQASMLQQQLLQTNQNLGAMAGGPGDMPSITGHGATFMNYSHYFNTFGNLGMGGMGGIGGASGMGGGMMGMGARPAGMGLINNRAVPGAVAGGTSGRGMAPGVAGPRPVGPRR